MFIEAIRIVNLRGFKDETIPLDRYTCMVGPNGAGKSTVLCALNIFFRETEGSTTSMTHLEVEDFYQKDTSIPIEITVTFTDLNDAEKSEFEGYYRAGKLIVTAKATYDPESGHAVVKQYGNRMAIPALAPFFEAMKAGAKVADLKAVFNGLRGGLPGIKSASTKDQMVTALHEFEEENSLLCQVIASEDMFYGVGQAGRLRRFVQWVYIPAVKDAAAEQSEARNTAFGRLIARTVRAKVNFVVELEAIRDEAQQKYQELIDSKAGALDGVARALQQSLSEWSIPDATAKLSWHQDARSAIRVEEPAAKLTTGDGIFEGNIARFGHGMQRSYLIALLQGLTLIDDSEQPTLILGCEEPELYQHPPQARHLCSVLENLSESNSQVLLTTHSPLFLDGRGFESVRMVRKTKPTGSSRVTQMTIAQLSEALANASGEKQVAENATLAKLNQALQLTLSEMFFTEKLILVEGLEDQALLTAWLRLTDRWEKVRAGGCYILPVGGKSEIARPLAISNGLNIPSIAIFDCDGDKLTHTDPNVVQSRTKLHERDNRVILSLTGSECEPFPKATFWGTRAVAWPSDFGKAIEESVGKQAWNGFGNAATLAYDGEGGMQKNTLHIAVRLASAFDANVRPEPLERVCDWIVDFAVN